MRGERSTRWRLTTISIGVVPSSCSPEEQTCTIMHIVLLARRANVHYNAHCHANPLTEPGVSFVRPQSRAYHSSVHRAGRISSGPT